jgi:hypothetical protein
MMTAETSKPDWRDEQLGARIRVALWLAEEVGEGNRFNKQQLRAITGHRIEQVDRRMRDLRPAGWVIKTYRDMAGLAPDELYLEKVGAHVWEPGQRSAGLRSISGKVRRQVMERDNHRCVRCGVCAGEEYPDEPGSAARLTLGHVDPHKHGSSAYVEDLVTECARCNETAKHLTGMKFPPEQIWDRITELPKRSKQQMLSWMVADRRPMTNAEEAWAQYRQLPGVYRDDLRRMLGEVLAATSLDSGD